MCTTFPLWKAFLKIPIVRGGVRFHSEALIEFGLWQVSGTAKGLEMDESLGWIVELPPHVHTWLCLFIVILIMEQSQERNSSRVYFGSAVSEFFLVPMTNTLRSLEISNPNVWVHAGRLGKSFAERKLRNSCLWFLHTRNREESCRMEIRALVNVEFTTISRSLLRNLSNWLVTMIQSLDCFLIYSFALWKGSSLAGNLIGGKFWSRKS